MASRRHQSLTAPPAAGSRKCRAGALSRQLQVPAGAAAKVLRLSGTPRAEPLGRCSPGRSGNFHKLPGAGDPDTCQGNGSGGGGGRGRVGIEGRRSWAEGCGGMGAGVRKAETPLSFGFGFGSRDCGCCRGEGSGPWDLSSDPEGETSGSHRGGQMTRRNQRTKGKSGWGRGLGGRMEDLNGQTQPLPSPRDLETGNIWEKSS